MQKGISKFLRAVLLFGEGMDEDEKKTAIAELISKSQPFFESKGFIYAKAYQAFKKRIGDFEWSFALNFFVHGDSFAITPKAGLRHDAIEKIFHQVSGAPDTVQQDSGTVLWPWALQKITPKPHSLTISRRSQVQAGIDFIEKFFNRWVEPFYREHCDLGAISNSYNDNRRILHAKYVTDWFEMLGRAIIAAKLTSRADYDSYPSY